MKKTSTILLFFLNSLLFFSAISHAQSNKNLTLPLPIIPQPVSTERLPGFCILSPKSSITTELPFQKEANYLRFLLSTLSEKNQQAPASIHICLDPSQPNEGYHLDISPEKITISGSTPAGVFYGIQTLRLLAAQSLTIPCLKIHDSPRFAWRGLMVDETGSFQGKRNMIFILNEMARLKLNVLHWHLTDDQAWRIEIKKYPKLTSIGAYRRGQALDTPYNQTRTTGPIYGGFYTQNDIREIVKFAELHHITIVPEIDIPAHCAAALAAYPEFSLGSISSIPVPTYAENAPYCLDITNPKTIEFIHNILSEVIDLFPSKIIHVGGDDVNMREWKKSPAIQKLMLEKKFQYPKAAQVYFTRELSNFLQSKGRTLMGWNDILSNVPDLDDPTYQLPKKTIMHCWVGCSKLSRKFAELGYDIVNSSLDFTYLNHPKLTLEDAYLFDPLFITDRPNDTKALQQHIIGANWQLGTENLPTRDKLEHVLFPRIAAASEVAWSLSSHKSYPDFLLRLTPLLSIWQQRNINFSREGLPEPLPPPTTAPQPPKKTPITTKKSHHPPHHHAI